ncbi:MAG: DUF2974 domain-containing protein [Clostridia bacterium]|nr:DUF2974 domain-containing protein [Clostridia bacterium]
MSNIHDYLAWRGDVPFSVSPFNEVDALVLSELAYANFKGVVAESGERVTIEEANRRFWSLHTKKEIMAQDSYVKTAPLLMEAMAGKARFGGTILSDYYDVIDTSADIQLAAITFYLPDETAFVAFRGTDDSVVGWKEDFNMSYMPETEGQRRAAKYLNEHFQNKSIPLRVGGHSKGGNLAVYAAVRAVPEVKSRILAVYNNDGPGFLKPFTESAEYLEMQPRIISVVPQESIIGTLLNTGPYRHIVKSTEEGIIQHDGFTWQVLGTHFVEVDKRGDSSLFIETTLHKWLEAQSPKKRRMFVNTLFGLLESTGQSTISQIKNDLPSSLSSMWDMLESMPKKQRETTWNMITQLFTVGSDALLQETKKAILSKLESMTLPQFGEESEPEDKA